MRHPSTLASIIFFTLIMAGCLGAGGEPPSRSLEEPTEEPGEPQGNWTESFAGTLHNIITASWCDGGGSCFVAFEDRTGDEGINVTSPNATDLTITFTWDVAGLPSELQAGFLVSSFEPYYDGWTQGTSPLTITLGADDLFEGRYIPQVRAPRELPYPPVMAWYEDRVEWTGNVTYEDG